MTGDRRIDDPLDSGLRHALSPGAAPDAARRDLLVALRQEYARGWRSGSAGWLRSTADRGTRVVVAEDEAAIRLNLRACLLAEGYEIIGEATDGAEALAIIRRSKPDVAILDLLLSEVDGLTTAREIVADRLAALVLLTPDPPGETVRPAGAVSYLLRTFQQEDLSPAITTAIARFRDAAALADEAAALSDRLQTRKVVERAKRHLQRHHSMSEESAFRFIQRAAMEQRAPMKQIANTILDGTLSPEMAVTIKHQHRDARDILSKLKPGDRTTGRVTSITDYGAFVDLGGISGLVHLTELSWHRVRNAATVVALGDEVEVVVLDVKPKKRRISLSIRRTQPDPLSQLAVGEIRSGSVTRLVDFGAFVRLGDLEGLVHLTELTGDRVSNPSDVVVPGDEVSVKILSVDTRRRRFEASIRQAAKQTDGTTGPV